MSIIPIDPIINVSFQRDLLEISLSFISMNCETSIELKNTATTNEEPKTTESVIGK